MTTELIQLTNDAKRGAVEVGMASAAAPNAASGTSVKRVVARLEEFEFGSDGFQVASDEIDLQRFGDAE